MNLSFLKFWERKLEKKNNGEVVEIPVDGSLGEFLGLGQNMTSHQAFTFYRDCQGVATVIDGIAELIPELPLYLEIDGEVVTDHEVLSLLKSPHPDYTGRLFMTSLATYFLLTGEAYIFAGGNFRYPPLMIAPISPANVATIQGDDGFSSAFQIGSMMYQGVYKRVKLDKRWIFLNSKQKQIKQIRRFSTKDNSQYNGESKLLAAANDVRQNLAGTKHNINTLVKGGRLTLLFSILEDLNPEKFAEAKEQIISQYSSDQGQSIAVVKGSQIDVKEMGVTNKDMDFATLQKMTEKAIAKRYNYPLALISDDSSTFNNLSTAYQALYDNCVMPVARQLYDALGALLLPRYNLDPALVHLKVDDSSVPAIALRMAEIAQTRRNSYTWKENELRAGQGLDPLEDGDKVYRPANLMASDDGDDDDDTEISIPSLEDQQTEQSSEDDNEELSE